MLFEHFLLASCPIICYITLYCHAESPQLVCTSKQCGRSIQVLEDKTIKIVNLLHATRYTLYALFIFALLATFCAQTTFADGSIIGWGSNDYGQATPPTGNNYIAISAGLYHGLALRSDGSIVGWGYNSYGRATPPTGNNYIAISAGLYHGLALRSDGSIVGWGDNEFRQATPPPGNNYIAISTGWYHSLALRSDGTIVGWGYNYYGQATPPPGNNYIAISAGGMYSLALRSDGSIVGWGDNVFGQATPPPGNNYIAISAGYYHSLALRSDGSIVGWGFNMFGQATPPPGNNYIAISAGEYHSLALRSDGSIVGWGYNGYGQATPPTGNNYIAISAGWHHSLALRGILTEISSTETVLRETLYAKQGILDNGDVTGDMNGVFDFNNFDTVTITTGPWSGKGFSKAQCQTTLEGVPYKGIWQGFLFLKPQERRIYLKGSTSGEIAATVEGYLTESVSDSNVYDHYQATWKIGRLGTTTTSATINLNGTLTYQSSSEFPSTPLYILQSSIGGTVCGHYVGPLSSVINHIRIADSNNPYYGEGFSIISYVSGAGQGEGWTYNKVISPGVVEMKGLFDSPLFGIVSGTLDETKTPRTVSANIQRVDLGLPPMADLEVKIWGPERVSPGQTVNYIIEYRNDGLRIAENALLVTTLPFEVEYISSTYGGYFDPNCHNVFWELFNLPPRRSGLLAVTVRASWGLPRGFLLDVPVLMGSVGFAERDAYLSPENTPFTDEWFEHLVLYSSLIDTVKQLAQNCWSQGDTKWGDEIFIQDNDVVAKNFREIIEYISIRDSAASDRLERLLQARRIKLDPTLRLDIAGKFEPVFVRRMFINQFITVPIDDTSDVMVDLTKDFTQLPESQRTQVLDYISGVLVHETQHSMDFLAGKIGTESDACLRSTRFFYTTALEELNNNNIAYVSTLLNYAKYQLLYLASISAEIGQPYLDTLQLAVGLYEKQEWLGFEVLLKAMIEGISKDLPGFKTLQRNTQRIQSAIAPARDPNRKLGPNGRVLPGQKLNYKVEYENEGEGIAFGVYFTDTLDEDLDDSTVEIGPVIDVNTGVQIAPPGNYNSSTRTITWLVGEVDPNQGGYADFSVNVKPDAPHGAEIINFATVYFPSVPEETRTNGVVSIVTPFGDIDQDGDVDFGDYAVLANQWLQLPVVPSADIAPAGGDGIVDFWDLAMIAEYWLEGTSP